MIGGLGAKFARLNLALGNQLGQDFGIMVNLKVAAHLRVFILQRIITMRADHNDLLNAVVVERLEVLLYQGLVQVFVAQPSGRVAAAELLSAQVTEADPGLVEDSDQGFPDPLIAVVEGYRTAGIEQVFKLTAVFRQQVDHLANASLGEPLSAVGPANAPGVVVAFHVGERHLRFTRHISLPHNQIASHFGNLGDVFDEHRAMLHTSAAVGAIPDYITGYHIVNQALFHGIYSLSSRLFGHGHRSVLLSRMILSCNQVRHLGIPVLLHILNQGDLRIEVLAGVVGRAVFLAASAADAGIQVYDVFPTEFFDFLYTEGFGFFNVLHVPQSRGAEVAESIIDHAGHDVPQFGKWNQSDKCKGNPHVEPPHDAMPYQNRFQRHTSEQISKIPAKG